MPTPRSTAARRAPPSALDDHLGYWLRTVSNQVSAEFARSVEAQGVTVSEWVALRRLLEAPATHSELVAALGMTKGAVSKLARALEDKQLIARVPSEADARSETLRLTPAGRGLVPRLAKLADTNDERFFGHLDPAERARLRGTLEAIARRNGIDTPPID